MMKSLQDSGFDVDPFVVNLGRGLVTLEGTIHLISPKLNIMQVITSYLASSFDLSRIQKRARRVLGQTFDSAEAMVGLPTKAAETLDRMQKGHVKVGMELSGDEGFVREARRIAALLAYAMVAMALIIGFCILGASPAAPQVAGVSVTGGIGLLCGIVLAVYVIVKGRGFLK